MEDRTIMQENNCFGCGGQMIFDPSSQNLVCELCGATSENNASGTDAGLECPNCGAELTTIRGARQAKCEACDSTFSMLQDGEDCELTGDIPEGHKYIAPFSVAEQAYQKGMITWLANEDLTPVDVFDKMAIVRSEGCYIPYYYCVANFKGRWTASIGYDRTETFTVHERRVDSKGKATTVPVTKTRVVTDWKPFSSTITGKATNLVEASRHIREIQSRTQAANSKVSLAGIQNSSKGLFEPLGNIDLNRMSKFDPKFTAGFTVLPCDEPASVSYDKQKINAEINQTITRSAPGDRIRDISFQGNIIPTYFMVFRPHWTTIYSYNDKICFHIGDGTDESKHYGTRPIDKDQKKRIRRWLIVFCIAFVTAVISVFFAAESAFFVRMFTLSTLTAIITGIIWVIVRWRTLRKGRQICIERSKPFLANPSGLFGRRSGKTDPMA
jgi:ribosomal protein S27E